MFFVRAGVPYLRQWGRARAADHAVGRRRSAVVLRASTNDVAETFERPKYPGGVRADLTRDYSWGELRGGLDIAGRVSVALPAGPRSTRRRAATDERRHLDAGGRDTGAVDRRADQRRCRIGCPLQPGVRGSSTTALTGEDVLDPRLAIRERLTDHLVLRETVGRFHQPPTPGDVDPNGGNPKLKSSYFDQVGGRCRRRTGTVGRAR